MVTRDAEGGGWTMSDLLGRSMGRIQPDSTERYTIAPEGFASETMKGMPLGPFASVDDALAEIERHTRGVCRRVEDGGDKARS